ncbi:hypothetical protein PCA10_01190 [Metapseudomonas resinovorans NBRC 106553]|uniref:Tetratricopeptide repeat protein n=2 Tax=Metapseudomonas resinovorans TaxID=53412 RepID=S6AQ13_METRE|nr:hypothetical protein PCA10_01190 [Pseudomonas resinovorans NBRC 106553]
MQATLPMLRTVLLLLLLIAHRAAAAPSAGDYLGSQACATCHQAQYQAWQGSQHAHAMQHASAETVLGDFADARFEQAGVESRFYRRDERFYVWTEGADGRMAEFEVRYTFGLDPLQQYLVEFPDGRLQALTIAWDSRSRATGGQRWFSLYPDARIRPGDPLHWTAPSQNWNFMCADCHSTAVRKGYDAERDRFNTRSAEQVVGCEACHGPGAAHLRWARTGAQGTDKGLTLLLDERRGSSWRASLERLTARRSAPLAQRKEHEVCAQCHSRRAQIAEGYQPGRPLLDHYRPVTLEPGLYHADGQQREEVFISASFAQSRMFAAGVTCSDCHEPHGQKLRLQGNALCTQCHQAATFDTPAHHFHPPGSSGGQCVSCHMPETTYMVVDPRRDHSLRIPRPDLSERLGTPDACTQCHSDRSAAWAAKAIGEHYPQRKTGLQTFAEAFSDAEQGLPSAIEELAHLLGEQGQPAVVRASAAARLGQTNADVHWDALAKGLGDPDPEVRLASIAGLERAPAQQRAQILGPLLGDSLRAVRSEAARVLTDVQLPESLAGQYAKALAEYEDSLALHADRADSRVALALLRQRQGSNEAARAELTQALRLDPAHLQARLNLADLLRALGQDDQASALLAEGIARQPDTAVLHYALGLTQVRLRQADKARASLAEAFRLAPDDRQIAYARVLNLWSGDPGAALQILEKLTRQHPYDAPLREAATRFNWKAGQHAAALRHAGCLQRLQPQAETVQRLLGEQAPAAGDVQHACGPEPSGS